MSTNKDKERWSMKYWTQKTNPSDEITYLLCKLQQTLYRKQKALEKMENRIQQLKNIQFKIEELSRVSPA